MRIIGPKALVAILLAAMCASSPAQAYSPAASIKANLPIAGSVPPYIRVQVTGDNFPRSGYLPHALNELKKGVKLNSGGEYVIFAAKLKAPKFLNKDQQWASFVPVVFYGQGFKTVRRYAIIQVENVQVEDFGESVRHYVSNSPELLKEPGILLRGGVDSHETVRYLVHHKNGTPDPINFVLNAMNAGTSPARLELIEGGLEKDREESAPGHRTVLTFLKNRQNQKGLIINIKPGETSAIISGVFKPGEIISGIGEMRLLEGESVVFAIKAIYPGMNSDSDGKEIGEFQSFRGHGSFGPPYVDIKDEFIIGGRWKFISVGSQPLISINNGSTPLKGNYGVTHRIEVTLVNEQPQAENAELMFSPVSGYARGVVMVDGEIIRISSCKPPDTMKIKDFEVGPNAAKKVSIEMIPESGSFYPVKLVFKSRTIMPPVNLVGPALDSVE